MADEGKKLPYEVAEIVFRNPVSEPKSYQLYCESEAEHNIAPLDIFEIFLTIMMEGIFIKNNVNEELLKLFDENALFNLQPWLHSLGYHVNVDVIEKQNTVEYEQYYCKIILRDDPSWTQYFEMHNEITKRYHYIFGGNSPYFRGSSCTLKNLFAIFTLNSKIYKISFNCI